MRSDAIYADEIIAEGAIISGLIKSRYVKVVGVLKSNTINTWILNVYGLTDTKKVEAEEIDIHGRINAYTITSDIINLNISGISRVDEIEARELTIRSIVQYGVRGRLLAKRIYALKTYSEFTTAELYVCCKCVIGDFNRISRIIYGEIIDISPTSSFNERPLNIPNLCDIGSKEELRFALPT